MRRFGSGVPEGRGGHLPEVRKSDEPPFGPGVSDHLPPRELDPISSSRDPSSQ